MRKAAVWVVVLLVPIGLALGVLAIAWWIRADLTANLVEAQIDRLGLPASFRAPIEVEFGEIVLHDLRVGEGPPEAASDLTIRRTEVHFDWARLAEARVTELLLVGLEVTARMDDQGKISLGSLDALLDGDAEGGAEPPVLPMERVRLDQAHAELIAPSGVLSVEMDAQVEQADAGAIRAEAQFFARHPMGRGRAEITANGSPANWRTSGRLFPEALPEGFNVTPSAEIEFEASGDDEGIQFAMQAPHGEWIAADLGVRTSGVSAEARRSESQLHAEVRLDRVVDAEPERRFVPLEVRVQVDGEPNLASPLKLSFHAKDKGGKLSVRGNGTVDPETLETSLRLGMTPILFEPSGLQPGDLLPPLAETMQEVAGGVGFEGRVRRSAAGSLSATGTLQLDSLSFVNDLARVEDLNGALQVRGPEPLATAKDQELTAGLIDVGVPLIDNRLVFQVHSPERVSLRSAAFGFADGRLETGEAVLDLARDVNRLTLRAEGLDMARIFEIVQFEGLGGDGTLQGRLPIEVAGENVRVVDGILRSIGKGRIQYNPAQTVDAMASQQEQLSIAFDILEDFSYDELSIKVDGDTRGVMNLAFRIRGRNPDFENGREVAFNLNLEAHLSDLVRSGRAAYRVPEEIEKRVQRKEAR